MILIFSSSLHALQHKGVRKKEQWLETHSLGLYPFKCFSNVSLSLVLQTRVSRVTAAHAF